MIPSLLSINIDWDNIIGPIGSMFNGGNITDPITGNVTHVTGIFDGDPALFAAFVFLAFLVLTIIFGLGLIMGSVILIPASFAIFKYAPDFRIIVAIILGLIFGFALNRLIRR